MQYPTQTFFANLSPPGVYPPASFVWTYYSTTVPAGQYIRTVPWQPGVPLGGLIPITWQVTDIYFEIQNAGSTQSTVQIARSVNGGSGAAPFVTSNYVNDTPIVIPAGQHVCTGRPFTTAVIDNPFVNSGDDLQPVFSLGIGASLVSLMVTFVQQVTL